VLLIKVSELRNSLKSKSENQIFPQNIQIHRTEKILNVHVSFVIKICRKKIFDNIFIDLYSKFMCNFYTWFRNRIQQFGRWILIRPCPLPPHLHSSDTLSKMYTVRRVILLCTVWPAISVLIGLGFPCLQTLFVISVWIAYTENTDCIQCTEKTLIV